MALKRETKKRKWVFGGYLLLFEAGFGVVLGFAF
jgi:hypothetical protein